MSLSRERAAELLRAFRRQRIVVVGDLMLDRYIQGACARISPEAPVPVVQVARERAVPGGASNVAGNIAALGGRAAAAGVVGDDPAGRELVGLLRAARVDARAVLRCPGHRTTVKTRLVADRQQIARVDFEDRFAFTRGRWADFRRRLRRALEPATGVILEDYAKGVVTQATVDETLARAARAGIPSALDPKDNEHLRVVGVTLVTPNRKEAFLSAGAAETPPAAHPLRDAPLLAVGRRLMRLWRPQLLAITLGPQGMLLLARGEPPRHIPTRAREVYDVSGAGDTVIAACLLALAAGATPLEAAELANYAAGVVVGKLGTATCSPAELLAAVAADAGGGR